MAEDTNKNFPDLLEPLLDRLADRIAQRVARANRPAPIQLRFTTAQAAERLAMKPSTLAAAVRRGEVPHQRNGSRIFFFEQ